MDSSISPTVRLDLGFRDLSSDDWSEIPWRGSLYPQGGQGPAWQMNSQGRSQHDFPDEPNPTETQEQA
jgi:hypothetical protein